MTALRPCSTNVPGEEGKEQFLIPYFIAATRAPERTCSNLACWLKGDGFRPDQVQAFLPTPMALASTMSTPASTP